MKFEAKSNISDTESPKAQNLYLDLIQGLIMDPLKMEEFQSFSVIQILVARYSSCEGLLDGFQGLNILNSVSISQG